MYELECAVQHYAWGKIGNESTVAKLAQNNKDMVIEPNKNYAEFWMGTHQSGPSVIKGDKSLSELIKKDPKVLGDSILKSFGAKLPYLFKVLSVNQALSIQVHPDKKRAEELHASQPALYQDDNHKPEIAIALTEFEALSGFRPLNEIKRNLTDIPEFHAVIGEENAKLLLESEENNYTEPLKQCLRALLLCPKETVETQLNNLVERANEMTDVCSRVDINATLLLELIKNYPGDVGCFVIYFLNYFIMKPGDAIYLDANVPHAYLKGDCVECMACSDNVVRAGLTPKFKDVETLCSILDYECTSRSERMFRPAQEDEFTLLFKPPVPDFAVAQITVPKDSTYKLIKRDTASIILAMSGKGTIGNKLDISAGKSFFIVAGEEATVEVQEELVIFQAFGNP